LKGAEKMKFTKIQGNGNDFIVIESFQGQFSDAVLEKMALGLCRRRQSIGADGILVLERSEKADFRMRLFNSDGSEGEMCGNGARCIARYALENGHADNSMLFDTLAGPIKADVDGKRVTLHMGRTDLRPSQWNKPLSIEGEELTYSFLRVGVPHCVIFYRQCSRVPKEKLQHMGRSIRNMKDLFPEGTNVNFVEIKGEDSLYAVTYERGVEDLTESCGTGSTASAITANLLYGVKAPVKVENPGGVNTVHLEMDKDRQCCETALEGVTTIVASGEVGEDIMKDIGNE
jgi:diaminopimelate epimerase